MITEQALQEAIAECQGDRNPNRDTCMMLAAFYTIQDHLYPQDHFVEDNKMPAYSYSEPPGQVGYDSGTEFSEVIKGKDANRVLEVMDEAMSTIQVLMPRLYDGIIRQLNE